MDGYNENDTDKYETKKLQHGCGTQMQNVHQSPHRYPKPQRVLLFSRLGPGRPPPTEPLLVLVLLPLTPGPLRDSGA